MTPDRFYEESIQAVKTLNRRAVLLMGKNPLPQNLPKNIYATDYILYSQIFPHACAIVHQDGIGTVDKSQTSKANN